MGRRWGRRVSADVRITIAKESDVAIAIAQAGRLCREIAFEDSDRSRVTTAVSELARNIVKYAGRGEIALRRISGRAGCGVEVVARDDGPGIADTGLALADHFSSGGTLGLGLPGVKRMMDEFELESAAGSGTRVTVRKWR